MAGKRGFGSVRRLKSGRYQARYTGPDGISYSLGSFGTAKQADVALAKVRVRIDNGTWMSPEDEAAAEQAAALAAAEHKTTVAEFAEVWLASLKGQTHRHGSLGRLKNHILPVLGDVPLVDLNRKNLAAWWAQCCPDLPSQKGRCYENLHALLALAVEHELISANPLRIKGAARVTPKREPQTATVEQVEQLLAAMPPQDRAGVLLAAWCGLRIGEVLALQRHDFAVDPATPVPLAPPVRIMLRRHTVPRAGGGTVYGEGAVIVMRGSKEQERTETVAVPPHVVPEVWTHLEEHVRPEPTAWLFPARTDVSLPINHVTFRYQWRKARKAVGLPDLNVHDLRRTGSTLAAQAGATPAELRDRLRHRTSTAAERYIVAARGADAALAERMSHHVAATTARRAAPRTQAPVSAPQVDPVEAEVQRRVQERLRELGIEE
ncbi:tyrosine-type recombinase/integrase [Tsukamurella paurometabola]|uniref:Site-specific integrase n=1 Tax=Tsukamurella paurometabola TaxID=2061 RepID=A0ABS5NJK6_TSUPA|nr:site-specific integrase [Tsukamurella paurometabola]MBS4104007.1 site-specific integrase [Tsukamurella paurometabola]